MNASRLLFAGYALAATCLLSSCTTWVDEMRIRRDPNTIVNPDVDELERLEREDGTWIEPRSANIDSFEDQANRVQPPSNNPTIGIQPADSRFPSTVPNQTPPPSPPSGASNSAAPNSPGVPPAPPAITPEAPPAPQYDPKLLEELR